MRTFKIIANWKMNCSPLMCQEFAIAMKEWVKITDIEIVIAPPALYLSQIRGDIENFKNFSVAAQDCSEWDEERSRTGHIHAEMLAEIGCKYIILGHSERREFDLETDETIARKASIASRYIVPIICVGERIRENKKEEIIEQLGWIENSQMKEFYIAYEPIWAVGTGSTPSIIEISEAVDIICNQLSIARDRVLYGGSVTGENAGQFIEAQIGGFLVGRQSLKVDSFSKIVFSRYKLSTQKLSPVCFL